MLQLTHYHTPRNPLSQITKDALSANAPMHVSTPSDYPNRRICRTVENLTVLTLIQQSCKAVCTQCEGEKDAWVSLRFSTTPPS